MDVRNPMGHEHGTPSPAAVEFERRLPGWARPIAHGLCVIRGGGSQADAHFPVVNVGGHYLIAAVLGDVTGRRAGTGTYPVSAEQLQHAIELDAPSNTDPTLHHPNSAWWGEALGILAEDPGAQAYAVFVERLSDPVSSPADQRLRDQIARGDRAAYLRAPDAPRA